MSALVPRYACWLIVCMAFVAAPAQADVNASILSVDVQAATPETPMDFAEFVSTASKECVKPYAPISFGSLQFLDVNTGGNDGLRLSTTAGSVRGFEVLYFDFLDTAGGRFNYRIVGVTGDPSICDALDILPCALAYVQEVRDWATQTAINAVYELPFDGPPPVEDAVACV